MTLADTDLHDPALIADPYPFYDAARATPVLPMADGTVLVTSYTLVQEACARPQDFSNDIMVLFAGARAEHAQVKAVLERGWPQVQVLIMSDPPAHGRFRRLVNLAFSLARVNAIDADIRRLFEDGVERLAGQQDFVAAFAVPMPVAVIAAQLGLPPGDAARVKHWTDAFADRLGAAITLPREIECAEAVVEFQHAMMAEIERRRAAPHDDLLGDLVAASSAGDAPLTDAELLSIVQQLVVAGNETTTNTLSEGVRLLATHPDVAARLRADPALIPNAVEEMLRLASPVQGLPRIVVRDCELGGTALTAGTVVSLRFAAANRDPARFAEPHAFRPDRAEARAHLAFGRGVHQCIGNLLARRELTIAFELLLARFERIELAVAPAELRHNPNALLRGLSALPVHFA